MIAASTIAFVLVGVVCDAAGCGWRPMNGAPLFASQTTCEAAAKGRIGAAYTATPNDPGGPYDLLETFGAEDGGVRFQVSFGFATKRECEKAARHPRYACVPAEKKP